MATAVNFHWMENRSDKGYVTWGTPWKKGEVYEKDGFLMLSDGKEVRSQSKVCAYWQDGSVKWSSHTAKVDDIGEELTLEVKKDNPQDVPGAIIAAEDAECIRVQTKCMSLEFPKFGDNLIRNIAKEGNGRVSEAKLICILEEREESANMLIRKEVTYIGEVKKVSVEEFGPLKCTVKVEGVHVNKDNNGEAYPFIVYFTVYADTPEIKVQHTFICDIRETQKYFLKGVGIQFSCIMAGPSYNRHVKLAGDFGYMQEAMQMLTFWRPRVNPEIYRAQTRGEMLKLDREDNEILLGAIHDIPVWGSYRLYQSSSKFFQVKKKVQKDGVSYIDANFGGRAKGVMYIDSENGGVAVATKDFWQKYPSSLWADDINSDEAKLTMWFWSPEAEALDYRHYDDIGHSQCYYEGFDEVRSTPYGVASTNDLSLFLFDAAEKCVSDEVLDECFMQVQKPAQLLAAPEYYHEVKAFGEWALVKKDTPLRTWLEEQLDAAIDFYKNEIEQRNWYGLYNYGDFMHTYDAGRHCWKYDMGGFAWQNTELVPTLWLWYAFIRTGREDIFTMAEAMSRHTGDVDAYHLGEYKGIGSRHNVLHWGDACKEARIGMAGHHRAYYYLTGGDYRTGDVLDDTKDADFSLLNADPLRFFYDKESMKMPTHARSGPDWSTFTSNWMTAWERNGDTKYRDKIITGLNDIKQTPFKLYSGVNYEYDPATGHLGYIGENTNGSHLALCMGGPQTWFELAEMLEDEEFKDMMADYGAFYILPKEEKMRITNNGVNRSGWAYPYMATSMVAYSAARRKDADLGYKVWQILVHSLAGRDKKDSFEAKKVENYFNNKELKEMFWISTNFTAQWCLNTIVALGLTEEYLPGKIEDCEWEDWVK